MDIGIMLIPIERKANNGECKREKCKDYDRNIHSKLDLISYLDCLYEKDLPDITSTSSDIPNQEYSDILH